MNIATLAEHQHASHVVQRIVELQVWSQLDVDAKIDVASAIGKIFPCLHGTSLAYMLLARHFQWCFQHIDRQSAEQKEPAKQLREARGMFSPSRSRPT